MSNLWLNIRIGKYHLQIGDPNWWSIRFRFNNGSWEDFEVYRFPLWRK
ncbi:hypothetical protein KAR91_41900 [Candidatus Pacearchaeota archaeon]|nr:hypothetical protein [Candidatus Pacearchaeota archaeon]